MTGRLIDADALKEALNKSIVEAIQHGNNFSDAFKNDSQEWSAEIWTIEDKIDNAPTVEAPQWIPVSERLPDFGVDVLVCDGEGVQVTAKRTWWSTDPNCWATNYCGYDYSSWDFMTNGDIVAWMELPKPYERKQG